MTVRNTSSVDSNGRAMCPSRTALLALAALALALPPAGCIELQYYLGGIVPGGDGPGITNDNGEPSDNDNVTTDLRVNLAASNLAPTVNEELQLTCTVIEGDPLGVTYAFLPELGRLVVDGNAGTASLVITEADIGVSYEFTCTATDEDGTSPPSNSVIVVGTDLPDPGGPPAP